MVLDRRAEPRVKKLQFFSLALGDLVMQVYAII